MFKRSNLLLLFVVFLQVNYHHQYHFNYFQLDDHIVTYHAFIAEFLSLSLVSSKRL